jgi:hypothetical protein
MSVTRAGQLFTAETQSQDPLAAATTHITASAAGDYAVDVTSYEGDMIAAGEVTVSSGTIAVKVQTCATSGGSYTDIVDAAVTGLTGGDFGFAIPISKDRCQKYVKLYFTASGESKSAYAGAALLGIKKYH